jgi:hypothetical protein
VQGAALAQSGPLSKRRNAPFSSEPFGQPQEPAAYVVSPWGLFYAHKFAIHCLDRGRAPTLDSLFMYPVIPAQAGIHRPANLANAVWIPACAGMTGDFLRDSTPTTRMRTTGDCLRGSTPTIRIRRRVANLCAENSPLAGEGMGMRDGA